MTYSLFEKWKCVYDLSDLRFKPCPKLFNRVKIWTVRWQKKQLTSGRLNQDFCALWFMKNCVIHNNSLSFFKFRQKHFFNPYFKKFRVTCAFIGHGRKDFFSAFCGYKTVSRIAFSGFFIPHFFAYFSAPKVSTNIGIYATFINKNKAFRGYRLYLANEVFAFFFASLNVEERFFLNVILRRLRAKNMAGAVTWKCSAICFK